MSKEQPFRATEGQNGNTGRWEWNLELETPDGPLFWADFYRNEAAAKCCAAVLNVWFAVAEPDVVEAMPRIIERLQATDGESWAVGAALRQLIEVRQP